MIRYAPKTPEGRAFDPIASALTAVAPIFKAAGAVKCQYEVEGIRGEYPVDGSFAATFAQDIRAKLGASEHFEINVDLVLPDGSEKIVVEVHNDLVCVPSAPSKIDGLTNGDFGEQALCYPEALDPAKSRSEYKVISTKSGTTAKGGRPYYAVVVGEVEAGRIICHGPWYRCFEEAYYFGTDDHSLEGNPIDVYTFDPNYKSKQGEDSIPEVVIVDENGGKFFFTNPDFGSVPILFTQAAQFIDGRILAYIDYLKALQIVCFIEKDLMHGDMGTFENPFIRSDGNYYIPVHWSGRFWYLDDIAVNFWQKYVSDNGWIKSLFAHISASEREMYLTDSNGDKIGSITKQQGSQACYALSYVYLLALGSNGCIADAISYLQSCCDTKGGLVSDGKYISSDTSVWDNFLVRDAFGNTHKVNKSGAGKKGNGNKRGSSYVTEWTLEDLKQQVGENGAFILGYDPDTTKEANQRPDHFIVARYRNGRIYVEFDPYRVEGSTTYNKPGTDITASYSDFSEACVHVLKFGD